MFFVKLANMDRLNSVLFLIRHDIQMRHLNPKKNLTFDHLIILRKINLPDKEVRSVKTFFDKKTEKQQIINI